MLKGLDATVQGWDVDALVTGAVEVCAGLWGRTLAAAKVEGTAALPARIRHRIGRDLIRRGESGLQVRMDGGRVMLDPASAWEVLEGWRYRLDFQVPPGKLVQRTVPRAGVVHFEWNQDPREQWCGLGPLDSAPKLRKLVARVEDKLAQDLATPVAHLVPITADGGDSSVATLRSDIGGAEGGAVTVETTAEGWDDPKAAPRHDRRAERLVPSIPDSLLKAQKQIASTVFQACGILDSLAAASDSDGTQLRKDYRRFIMASVEPVASMIEETASEALDTDESLDFSGLWAHDLQGQAAAFQKLVAGGMSLERAVQVSGLIPQDVMG